MKLNSTARRFRKLRDWWFIRKVRRGETIIVPEPGPPATVERLRAVLATIQNADVTYGIISDGGESVTPMMVERDAIVEALYG